jgi:hypothetical protein
MASTTRPRYRKWTPTPEQAEWLKAIEPTGRFLHNLPADVLKKYGGQWIAARDCEIVVAAPTRAELEDALGDLGLSDSYTLRLRLESGINIRWRRLS